MEVVRFNGNKNYSSHVRFALKLRLFRELNQVYFSHSGGAPRSRTGTGFNRAEVFEGLQPLGAVSLDGTSDSFPIDFLLLDPLGGVGNNNTDQPQDYLLPQKTQPPPHLLTLQ